MASVKAAAEGEARAEIGSLAASVAELTRTNGAADKALATIRAQSEAASLRAAAEIAALKRDLATVLTLTPTLTRDHRPQSAPRRGANPNPNPNPRSPPFQAAPRCGACGGAGRKYAITRTQERGR